MDYFILMLLAVVVAFLLIIHQDIVSFGNAYDRIIQRITQKILPRLAALSPAMKSATTFSCFIFFAGVIGFVFTLDGRWLRNAVGLAAIPPLIQFIKGKFKRHGAGSADNNPQ